MTSPIADLAKAFIVDPYEDDSFEFQHAPKVLKFTKKAEINKTTVPGEHLPRHAPTGGGSNGLMIQTTFQAVDREVYNEDWVELQCIWLQSLAHPRVINEATGVRSLTPVLFVQGDFVELPIYVNSVRVTYANMQPRTLKPMTAQVEMDVEETALSEWVDAYSARQGKALRRQALHSNDAGAAFGRVAIFDTPRTRRGYQSKFEL